MKIALAGSHGTGKTTLAECLREKLIALDIVATITEETPRLICDLVDDQEYFRRGNNSLTKQLMISLGQLVLEEQSRTSDIQICDRTLMDHLAYSMYLFPEEILENDFLTIYEKFIAEHCKSYDKIFYFPIEFKPVDDGMREADEAFQAEIDRLILMYFHKHLIPYETVRGSVENRCDTVMKSIMAVSHLPQLSLLL
jgi:thymidylate kinase